MNWPFGIEEKNPANVLPRNYRDTRWSFLAFRNRWRDEDDIVISVQTKPARGYHKAETDARLHVAAFGEKFAWGRLAGDVLHWRPAADGSAVITVVDGTSMAVDFSGASGAEGLLVTTGDGEGLKRQLGSAHVTLRFLSSRQPPVPRVEGDTIVVGEQTLRIENGHLVLGTMREPAMSSR